MSRSLLKLMSIDSTILPSNRLIVCHPFSPFDFHLSQHQGLFQWVSSSHEAVKVLKLQLQHQSFQWKFRVDFFRIDKRLCKLGNFIKIKVFHERGLIHVLFLLFLQNLLKWVLGIRQRNNEKGGKCVQAKVVSSLWPSKDPDSVMPKCSVGVFSHVRLFENPWIVVHQAPLPMGFPSQEYWGGFPCPPPGDLPDPGIEPESSASPASAGGFCFFYHWATKKTQIL